MIGQILHILLKLRRLAVCDRLPLGARPVEESEISLPRKKKEKNEMSFGTQTLCSTPTYCAYPIPGRYFDSYYCERRIIHDYRYPGTVLVGRFL